MGFGQLIGIFMENISANILYDMENWFQNAGLFKLPTLAINQESIFMS